MPAVGMACSFSQGWLAPSPQGGYLDRMRISVEKLTAEALALPADARALLADQLAESLDPFPEEYVRALWAVEALRRRDEVHTKKVIPIPAETVFDRVRESLNG